MDAWPYARLPPELMDEAPHYAEAFSLIRGRCFRFVTLQAGAGPVHCPEPQDGMGPSEEEMAADTPSRLATATERYWSMPADLRHPRGHTSP